MKRKKNDGMGAHLVRDGSRSSFAVIRDGDGLETVRSSVPLLVNMQ